MGGKKLMIKCEECGEEFSYGRKISCCNSIHFGMIFSASKKDHKWNCNPDIINYESFELYTKEILEMLVVDDEEPIYYDWNCETSKRFKRQKNMEIKGYVILYE